MSTLKTPPHANSLPEGWRSALLWLLGLLALTGVLLRETALSMPATWERSETFAHGWLIVPISLWLIWERRRRLAQTRPQPAWQGLLLGLGFGFAWLLGEVTGTLIVQQYAFVSLVICACISALGLQAARAIAFPLAFLYFAVPIGEGLIPPLMDFTADFSVWLLRLSGVAVFQEGTFISLPSGEWSVVEGCSGVRYLIATLTLCCLYAWLTYRSPLRRAVFMIAAVFVPIIANGLRAYMIMMIGHLSSMKLAGGVDHLLYGWVFFGLVIFLMFTIGAWWREAPEADNAPMPVAARAGGPAAAASAGMRGVPFLHAVVIALFPAWASLSQPATGLPPLSLPTALGPWVQETAAATTGWEAETRNPDQRAVASYRLRSSEEGADIAAPDDDGPVAVAFAGAAPPDLATSGIHVEVSCYAGSRQDAELLNSQNRLVRQKHPDWQLLPAGLLTTGLAQPSKVHLAEVRGRSGAGERLMVWDWWWLAGEHFTNAHYGKLREGLLRLVGGETRGCWLVLATSLTDGVPAPESRLRDFAQRLAAWQDAAARGGDTGPAAGPLPGHGPGADPGPGVGPGPGARAEATPESQED